MEFFKPTNVHFYRGGYTSVNFYNKNCAERRNKYQYKIEQEYWAILKTFLVFLKTIKEEELPGVKISKNLLTNLENIKWAEQEQ